VIVLFGLEFKTTATSMPVSIKYDNQRLLTLT